MKNECNKNLLIDLMHRIKRNDVSKTFIDKLKKEYVSISVEAREMLRMLINSLNKGERTNIMNDFIAPLIDIENERKGENANGKS